LLEFSCAVLVSGSLFEKTTADSMERKETPRELTYWDNKSWDQHVEARNETAILERSAALGLDYIYSIELPSDATSEDVAALTANIEYSNLPERALCRLVLGPAALHVDAGATRRLRILASLAASCESCSGSRYGGGRGADAMAGGGGGRGQQRVLEIPTKEEIDSLENNNPCRQYQVTLLHPSLTFHGPAASLRLELGLRCLDATVVTPMYPLRNVKVATVMHPPSKVILNNCHNAYSATFMEFFCRLVHNDGHSSFKVASVEKLKLTSKSLLFKPYWKNIYQKQGDIHVELEALRGRLSAGAVLAGQEIFTHLTSLSPSQAAPDRSKTVSAADLAGSRLKAVVGRAQCSWTWTSRISTVSLLVDSLVSRCEQTAAGRERPVCATVFTGLQQRGGEAGQPHAADHWPSTPGKAERDVPVVPWLRLLLQFPVSAEIQFVPPIVVVNLSPTRLVLAPGLASLCRALFDPVLPDQQQQHMASLSKGAADSGFKSVEAGYSATEPESATPVSHSLLFSELLRSAIIKVKTDEFAIFLAEDLGVSGPAESVEDTLKLLRPGLTVLRLDLPKVEAFNSGARIDPSLFQQHPVLFPPSVWISGKDTLPVSVNLTGFQIRVGEAGQILAPVSTR
jgi:hypothetical protein